MNEEGRKVCALPRGWVLAAMQDLGPVISGGTPKTKEPDNFDGDIPWITPADLTGYKAKAISSGRRNITEKGLETSSARLIPARSVLFSSRAPIGYVAIAANTLATNQGFKSVVVSRECDEHFVYFYLKSAKALAEREASGTTFKELSGARFSKLPIPAAPLNEQRRIVEKIDTLFARLDAGEAALQQVRTQLARYRQSVLKAAVTGELTRDWRATHAGQLEPGRDLLARILDTRRENWQGRGKYAEPTTPDTTDLPELPDGWVWATVDHVLTDIRYGTAQKCRRDTDGVAVLRIPNVAGGAISLDDLKFTHLEDKQLEKLMLREGDILVVRSNGSVDLVGRSAVVTSDAEGMAYAGYLIRLRTEPSVILSGYLHIALESPAIRTIIGLHARSTSGVHNINSGEVKALLVPVPPLGEQHQIVARFETEMSRIDAADALRLSALRGSKALRQSILKEAFAGRLVPQDPDDEPASELLARIRAEREAVSTKRPRKTRRPA